MLRVPHSEGSAVSLGSRAADIKICGKSLMSVFTCYRIEGNAEHRHEESWQQIGAVKAPCALHHSPLPRFLPMLHARAIVRRGHRALMYSANAAIENRNSPTCRGRLSFLPSSISPSASVVLMGTSNQV